MNRHPPDLRALFETLSEGQRTTLHQHCAGLSIRGPTRGYAERYSANEARILAAIRSELQHDLARDIARGVIAAGRKKAPERPQDKLLTRSEGESQ